MIYCSVSIEKRYIESNSLNILGLDYNEKLKSTEKNHLNKY